MKTENALLQLGANALGGISMLALILLPIDSIIPMRDSSINVVGDVCLAVFSLALSIGLSRFGGDE